MTIELMNYLLDHADNMVAGLMTWLNLALLHALDIASELRVREYSGDA
jgi:hypothetical protein